MRDRDLVRVYWPVELRPAFDTLMEIDEAMAGVVAKATEPALGAIKLAWWRERLEELDQGRIPAEPRLKSAAAELLPRGLTGAELAELEDGWATLLDDKPDIERATERGSRLFALAGSLLGAGDPLLEAAGRLYGHASAARIVPAVQSWPIEELGRLARHRFPRRLRPLTALARLAARDARDWPAIEAEATPGRASALLRHWLSGRVA